MRKKSASSDGYTPQTTFEETADLGIAALRGHPFRTLGLVPSESPTYQFISHTWVHAGLIHLVATALLLLLVAPTLEALWGRALFGATIAIVPLMTAGVFYLVSQNGDRALVGAGALIAALIAATITHFREEQLDLLDWLPAPIKAEFIVPAWALGVFWVAYEALLWGAMPGVLPTGVDNAVGFSAHATGALIGVGVSFGFGKIKSDRAPAPAPIRKERRASQRFDLKKVVDLIDRGEDDDAFIMLHCEVEGSARNRDAVKLYWEMCLEREEPDRAAEALVRLLKEELRSGRPMRQAFDQAWSRAWPSIRDSNIAALITSAILFWFGNTFGATVVKGFSLTLAIGIVISLFSSLYITNTLLAQALSTFKIKNLERWIGI